MKLSQEWLRQLSAEVESMDAREVRRALVQVIDESISGFFRAQYGLELAAARIAELETELAAARLEADHFRSLAVGATANNPRFLQ